MQKINIGICLMLILTVCTNVTAQRAYQDTVQTANANGTTPFHKWEIGINALALTSRVGVPNDWFGYVVKRNFQKKTGRQALRLKFLLTTNSPFVGPGNGFNVFPDATSWSVYGAAGYEWQKLYGRFAVLYGAEAFFRRDNGRYVDSTNVRAIAIQVNTGINAFLGGRYYMSKHFALTLESHLVCTYSISTTSYMGGITGYNLVGFVNPIHAIYISYHF